MDLGTVTYAASEGVGRVVLNRPAQLNAINRIEALPVPVIAGVHGLALAGGLELTLVADLVVADEGARRAKELMLLGGWPAPR